MSEREGMDTASGAAPMPPNQPADDPPVTRVSRFRREERRRITPQLIVIVCQFWLFVAGVAMLFFFPWYWGVGVMAAAAMMFLLVALIGA